jgi:hypothetical protein
MIFVDSNVPMYLVGGDHPNRSRAGQILRRLVAQAESLVTDAEVFQEILHRYTSIQRREAIGPAFQALRQLVVEIFPIEWEDVQLARGFAETTGLSARDAVHAAVMRRAGVSRILTFDRGFDAVEGLDRIE